MVFALTLCKNEVEFFIKRKLFLLGLKLARFRNALRILIGRLLDLTMLREFAVRSNVLNAISYFNFVIICCCYFIKALEDMLNLYSFVDILLLFVLFDIELSKFVNTPTLVFSKMPTNFVHFYFRQWSNTSH